MKTTIKTLIAFIFTISISCSKNGMTPPASVKDQSSFVKNQLMEKILSFSIGQHYQGGIIFYIDNTGQHGLIAATEDIGLIQWVENRAYVVTGATDSAIGTGNSNTNKIVNAQGKPVDYAAHKCKKYSSGGYTNWFLPSKDELNELYKQKNVVGNFTTNHYWSSTEVSRTFASSQSFKNGNFDPGNKNNAFSVRPIHNF
ncbi:MAG: DUF1566 domain-containing protein [Chitinophagaceae bacterium]